MGAASDFEKVLSASIIAKVRRVNPFGAFCEGYEDFQDSRGLEDLAEFEKEADIMKEEVVEWRKIDRDDIYITRKIVNDCVLPVILREVNNGNDNQATSILTYHGYLLMHIGMDHKMVWETITSVYPTIMNEVRNSHAKVYNKGS